MKRLLVDLGTSRTAIAAKDPTGQWITWPLPNAVRDSAGVSSDKMGNLLSGLGGVRVIGADRFSYLQSTSSFVRMGNVVAPFSPNLGLLDLPSLVDLVPNPRTADFQNIKDDTSKLEPFGSALTTLVKATVGDNIQWVIGRSAGALANPAAAFPGARCINEAVAVMYTAIAYNIGGIREAVQSETHKVNTFILVADLGGGFLDITLGDDLKFADKGSARIVNYGGYPIGVDRVDTARRFTEAPLPKADELFELVQLAVGYHLWDYFNRRGVEGKHAGLILLTGGGFRRLPNLPRPPQQNPATRAFITDLEAFLKSQWSNLDINLQLRLPTADTKYLTLAGLAHVAESDLDDEDAAANISSEKPNKHGEVVLKWMKKKAGAAENWAALLGELRPRF